MEPAMEPDGALSVAMIPSTASWDGDEIADVVRTVDVVRTGVTRLIAYPEPTTRGSVAGRYCCGIARDSA